MAGLRGKAMEGMGGEGQLSGGKDRGG